MEQGVSMLIRIQPLLEKPECLTVNGKLLEVQHTQKSFFSWDLNWIYNGQREACYKK